MENRFVRLYSIRPWPGRCSICSGMTLGYSGPCKSIFDLGRDVISDIRHYCLETANLAFWFDSTWGSGAVKHSSQPARAPKTKLKPSVSQKWLRTTLAGINGIGDSKSKTVVQQAKTTRAHLVRCSAIHFSVRASRRSSGRLPPLSISSWNVRISNLGPSCFRARSRSSRNLSWPIL